MEMIAIKIQPFLSYRNPKIIVSQRQSGYICNRKFFSLKLGYGAHQLRQRSTHESLLTIQAVSPGVQDIEVSSSFEGFTTMACYSDQDNELRITVEVSGTKTQEIFDNVFSKMVADAQPIPGFRRVKGGKTPNLPKNILLEILGPSKVYEQVIKKVIDSTISGYVAKEHLMVGKDLQVEQSFEDLEAGFEPGESFKFDAIIQCQDSQVE